MSRAVPEYVDPWRSAKAGQQIQGCVSLCRMRRLAPGLADTQGTAEVSLAFGIDNQGIHYLRGRVDAELQMVCQRCLEPMPVSIATELILGIVADEAQAQRLPSPYEPLIATSEPMPLVDLIEDELMLALPAIVRHDANTCTPPADGQALAAGGQDSAEKNPFAVLADLKNRADGTRRN